MLLVLARPSRPMLTGCRALALAPLPSHAINTNPRTSATKDRHESSCRDLGSEDNETNHTCIYQPPWKFAITHTFPVRTTAQLVPQRNDGRSIDARPLDNNEHVDPSTKNSSSSSTMSLLDFLVSHKPLFGIQSASHARRIIKQGEILILAREKEPFDPHQIYTHYDSDNLHEEQEMLKRICINPSLRIQPDCHQIHRVTRVPNNNNNNNPQQQQCCYPIQVTKSIYPPKSLQSLLHHHSNDYNLMLHSLVAYENHEMAILCKPQGMVTIGGGGSSASTNGKKLAGAASKDDADLQSLLPFVLFPPPPPSPRQQQRPPPLPRPVHRLDRGTSGLVLVAKTSSALSRFSSLFANQQIQKTYTAVVFGCPSTTTTSGGGIMDDPMSDGKPATTHWRLVSTNGAFSRLELQPKTGRFHQLRRHLAYCLGTPIVGDAKYDLVGIRRGGGSNNDKRMRSLEGTDATTTTTAEYRKSFRPEGLMLCCHKLEFDYPTAAISEDDNNICSGKDGLSPWLQDPSVGTDCGGSNNTVRRVHSDNDAMEENEHESTVDDCDPDKIRMAVSIDLPPNLLRIV